MLLINKENIYKCLTWGEVTIKWNRLNRGVLIGAHTKGASVTGSAGDTRALRALARSVVLMKILFCMGKDLASSIYISLACMFSCLCNVNKYVHMIFIMFFALFDRWGGRNRSAFFSSRDEKIGQPLCDFHRKHFTHSERMSFRFFIGINLISYKGVFL